MESLRHASPGNALYAASPMSARRLLTGAASPSSLVSPINKQPLNESTVSSSSSVMEDTPSLSAMEIKDLQRAFSLLDTKKEGSVSLETLSAALAKQPSTSGWTHRVHAWIKEARRQKIEQLTFDDFVHALTAPDPDDTRSELQKVFDLFAEGKTYIDRNDLQRVATELGESMNRHELDEMIERANATDGRVTYEMFEKIMYKQLM